jgi:DNA-binding transcriptional LysR family regulator
MELHQLRYFVTAVRLGTMSAAARELYVSQPSISQQIRALERELGASLVVRMGRRLALTDAGEQFLGEAERAVAAADAARERVQQIVARGRAAIRLGAVPSVDSTLLPPALDRFMSLYPEWHVVVLEPHSAEVEALLIRGELDVAITHFAPTSPALTGRVLVREELVLVGPANHWALGQSSVSLSQLRDEWFVTSPPGSDLHERLLGLCAEAGFTPRIALAARYGALREMVLAGHGLAILPRLIVNEGLRSIPIANALAPRELYVISKPRRKLGPAVCSFLAVLDDLA